jgi:hypothetical protein
MILESLNGSLEEIIHSDDEDGIFMTNAMLRDSLRTNHFTIKVSPVTLLNFMEKINKKDFNPEAQSEIIRNIDPDSIPLEILMDHVFPEHRQKKPTIVGQNKDMF